MERIKKFLHFNAWVLFADILAFGLSYLLGIYIRFFTNEQLHLGQQYLEFYWSFIPYCIVASVIVFAVFRLYGGMWQYAGLQDFNRLLLANAITVVLHVGISIFVISLTPEKDDPSWRMPTSYYVLGAIIQLLATCITRFANRFFQAEKRRLNRKFSVNVMLVGTGETARIVRRQIEDDPSSGENIACIFTYRDSEAGNLINGTPVVGKLDQLKTHFEKYQIQRVILADSLMPMNVRERIKTVCQETGIESQDFSGFLRYDSGGLSFIVNKYRTDESAKKHAIYSQITVQIEQEQAVHRAA